MKTTLRYLLMTIAILGVLSVNAQTHQYVTTHYSGHEQTISTGAQVNPQMPTASMGYTHSDYMTSGSTLPQSAVTGTSTTYGEGGGPRKGGPRRALDDDDKGEGGQTPKPGQPFPIGDAAIPLAVAAAVYCVLCMVYRRRKRTP